MGRRYRLRATVLAVVGVALAAAAVVLGGVGSNWAAWFLLTPHASLALARGWLRQRKAGRSNGERPPDWSAQASRGLRLDVSPHTALGRAEVALRALPLCDEPERRDGALLAWTSRHVVTVTARPVERHSILTVESHPIEPRMFDRGRSQKLVDAVADALTQSPR